MNGATKQLLLVRHAEAVVGGGNDRERSLTANGVADARRLGAHLLRQGWQPGHLAVSSALRALQTVEALCQNEPRWRRAIATEPSVYLADVEGLGTALRGFPAVPVAAVVGHNPGLSQWVEHLCGERLHLATAEALLLGFPVACWDQVEAGSGSIVSRYAPARLRSQR